MPDTEPRASELSALLERVEAVSPVDAIAVAADELAARLGARDVDLLIADYSGRGLVRLGDRPRRRDRRDGPRADRSPDPGAGRRHRGDRAPARPRRRREPALHRPLRVGQRTTALSLSAEIQRRLLPPAFTCEAGQFTFAGWLEPASTVGGDTFDYALDRGTLHLSITDATGHDVEAAMLATVLVGALRNGRRAGKDLHAQVVSANDQLATYSSAGAFVTGQVVRIDLEHRTAHVVNAGHPNPLRLRDGRVEEIELAVDRPFGLEPGREFRVQPLALEPGDRIVFVTDGMLERHAAELDVHRTLRDTAHLHPREVVHALGTAVLRVCGGNLRDDATVFCVDWYGGSSGRVTQHGASRERASS